MDGTVALAIRQMVGWLIISRSVIQMGKKRFSVSLTLSDLYAIRNALRNSGTDEEVLKKIEDKIKALHDYFDGRERYIRS